MGDSLMYWAGVRAEGKGGELGVKCVSVKWLGVRGTRRDAFKSIVQFFC